MGRCLFGCRPHDSGGKGKGSEGPLRSRWREDVKGENKKKEGR